MTMFSVLKRNARLALRGNWGKAILIVIICFAASAILNILQQTAIDILAPSPTGQGAGAATLRYGVNEYFFQRWSGTSVTELVILTGFALLYVLLLSPLHLGSVNWYYLLIHGKPAPVSELFRFFESGRSYARSLWYEINLTVRCFLWALLFYAVPGGIFGVSLYTLLRADEFAQRTMAAMSSLGILLSVLLFVLATVFYLAVVNRYALTAYLLCEKENMSVREAIKASVSFTKSYRFSFLWFELSFFGWALLLAFLLPALYVVPYFNTSCAMYARYIIEKNRFVPPEATKEFVIEQILPPEPQEESPPPGPFDSFKQPPPEPQPEEEQPTGEDLPDPLPDEGEPLPEG